MSNSLFDNFFPVSAKQWKQKIQFDLKGDDYNQTLLTQTHEGITIKPFYHADDFKQLEISEMPSSFKICQTIFINNEKTANYLAIDALNRGADSIKFIATKPFECDVLFQNLFLLPSKLNIYFQLQFLEKEFLLKLIDFVKGKTVFLNIDILGNLVTTGNWFYNHKKDHEILKILLKNNTSAIGVDVSQYQNSGANIVQQIAYALAHANEYLNFIDKNKIEKQLFTINFNFSIGGNYFFEIAKLKAFRYLWKLLIEEYNFDVIANIFVEPSLRNKTIYDYNTNMLRTTTECMSAILGGANTISNVSYDTIFHKKNEFGERIARNQLLILKEESNLKNSDFVKGTYYIEELTYEIAEKSLTLFKNIENSGGFISQLFEGTIQRKIEENAIKEQQQFDDVKHVLLGINKYPNADDKMKDTIELYPFLKIKSNETTIKPVISKRLAEKLEKERLNNESIS
ncbi:MAG: methylmalonyl-CoA mutase subunit beta [Flavobacteriaceae bacterium]|nr:methylmalonyl-CoA mutase subunit beta [Flavobacteriaceae bacterium]